jgi:hypothetical protein
MSISTKLVIYPSKYTEEIQGGAFQTKLSQWNWLGPMVWEQTRPPESCKYT